MTLRRRTNRLVNVSLVLVSTIVSYFLIEIVFFRFIFPVADPGVRPFLPETPGVLAQSTKAHFVPHNYIAILGDSFAQGVGDALLAAGNNEARAFHAAHAIHDLTGRDVVTFGRGGSSSAEGFVRQPARILGGSRCFIFPTLDEPSRIFAYFYEGNDIQDNLAFGRKVTQRYGRSDTEAIDTYLSEVYGIFPAWQCNLYLFDIAARILRFWYQYYLLGMNPFSYHTDVPGGGTRMLVGERTIHAPAPLDGPAIEVSAQDIRFGVTVFDRSLAWLKARFADVPVTVVYVPSALSVYRLVDPNYLYSMQPRDEGKSGWATPAQIAANSDLLCSLVRDASVYQHAGFLDTRPGLRAAAATRLLHGPNDWVHFNAQGYRVMGELLSQRTDAARIDACRLE